MRKLGMAAAIVSTMVAGIACAPANAQSPDLQDQCEVPLIGDEKAFSDLQECLKALDARISALDASISQSAGNARIIFKNERELTDYARASVKAYADTIAALRANLSGQQQVSNRIDSLNEYSAQADDRQQASLTLARQNEEAKLASLRSEEATLREKAAKARSPAANYLAAVLSSRMDVKVAAPSPRKVSAACAQMVDEPDLTLDVSSCAAASIRSFAGGGVRVPGSFLNPRGFSALLSGSDSGGALGITYAREFKRRLPVATEISAQSFNRVGFSIGVMTGGGTVFENDDDEDFLDRFDTKLTITGGLFVNFYDAQPRQNWRAEAKKLSADAITACLEDQAKSVPSFRSSCSGQSLTDWVYAMVNGKNAFMHPEIARRTNALYFGSEDLVPRWGFGVEGSISRPSAEYLRDNGFTTFFNGSFDDAFEEEALVRDRQAAWSITPYLFRRFGSDQWKVQTVAAASFTIAREFGFEETAKKTLFCPATDTTLPFSLGSCKSYYTSPPTDRMVYTPSGELRFLIRGNGWWPTTAISPKLSYAFGEETSSGDPDRWTLSIPVLAFVDDQFTTGVGVKFDHSWGGTTLDDATGTFIDKDSATVVSLVFSKTFSLTGM